MHRHGKRVGTVLTRVDGYSGYNTPGHSRETYPRYNFCSNGRIIRITDTRWFLGNKVGSTGHHEYRKQERNST